MQNNQKNIDQLYAIIVTSINKYAFELKACDHCRNKNSFIHYVVLLSHLFENLVLECEVFGQS